MIKLPTLSSIPSGHQLCDVYRKFIIVDSKERMYILIVMVFKCIQFLSCHVFVIRPFNMKECKMMHFFDCTEANRHEVHLQK
jgi:hypothetical protein